MSQIERFALWGAIVVLALAIGIMAVVVAGELHVINATLADLAAGREPLPVLPTPQAEARARVGVAGVAVLSDTLALTVTVSMAGPGDLLYDPPALQVGSRTYPATGDSLEKARFAFLDLVTRGQATARLVFAAPALDGETWLVFNPSRQPGDPVAPQVRVLVAR